MSSINDFQVGDEVVYVGQIRKEIQGRTFTVTRIDKDEDYVYIDWHNRGHKEYGAFPTSLELVQRGPYAKVIRKIKQLEARHKEYLVHKQLEEIPF